MEMKKIIATMLLMLAILPAALAENAFKVEEVRCVQEYGPNHVPGPNDIVPTCYQKPRIDVVFVIDSTGSMADEIRSVKTHIVKIVKEVQEGNPRPDIRVGLVTYRDHKPEEYEYLYKNYQLTRDIEQALSNVVRIQANGGGDYPEAVADGLHAALLNMNWDANAKKIVFLIGDAAPHGAGVGEHSFPQGCPVGLHFKTEVQTAKEEGIKIYTIAGSGMDHVGKEIWKDIAIATNGEYKELEYVRRNVDQYYEEEEVDMRWVAEAKKDIDYDRRSNSILTNTFGSVAKAAMVQEAEAIGVSYDQDNDNDNNDDESWIDTNDIIDKPRVNKTSLSEFFRKVFDKITFWK